MAGPYNSRIRKGRELRDIFNKLRKKYRAEVVTGWLCHNYFMGSHGVYDVIQASDNEPVENPSILYRIAMADDFQL